MRLVHLLTAAATTAALAWALPAAAQRHGARRGHKPSAGALGKRVAPKGPVAELNGDPAPADVGGERLAAVDAFLKLEPRRFEELVHTHPDGSLKLDAGGRLELGLWQRPHGDGSFRRVLAYSADARPLLASHAKVPLGAAVDQRLLVPIVAQALGALRGSGGAGRALEALTGQPSQRPLEIKPTPALVDQLFTQLSAAVGAQRPIVAAAARTGAALRARLADAVETGLLDGRAADLTALAGAGPLPDGRSDTVFDAKRVALGDDELSRLIGAGALSAEDVESVGQNRYARFVYLRNPAAAYVPRGSAGTDPGLFRLPMGRFAVLYERLSIGGSLATGSAAELGQQALR